jgi:hypothetical protein
MQRSLWLKKESKAIALTRDPMHHKGGQKDRIVVKAWRVSENFDQKISVYRQDQLRSIMRVKRCGRGRCEVKPCGTLQSDDHALANLSM